MPEPLSRRAPTPYGPYEDECEICSACGGTLLSKGSAPLETACLQQPQFVSREDLGQVLPRLASLLSEIQNDLSRPWIRLRRFTTPSKETEEFLNELYAVVAQAAELAKAPATSDKQAVLRSTAEKLAARAAEAAQEARKANEQFVQCSTTQEQLNNKKKKHLEAAPKRSGHKPTVRNDVPKALREQLDRSKAALSDAEERKLPLPRTCQEGSDQGTSCAATGKAACRRRLPRSGRGQAALAEELQEMLDDLPAEPAGADAAAIDAIDAGFDELEEEDLGGDLSQAVVPEAVLESCGNEVTEADLFGEDDDDDAWV